MKADSGWQVLAAEERGAIAGFMAMRVDQTSRVGEIGLNAVHPVHAGRGIGTASYRLAFWRMKEAAMRAATVAPGGDQSHEPARRAYREAGFTAEIPGVWMYRLL